MLRRLQRRGFQVVAKHHAEAILDHDMKAALGEIETALLSESLPVEELVRGGGGEGQLTQRIRRTLAEGFAWQKHTFEVRKIVDGREQESLTHVIDHVKTFPGGTIALEIEWNNKDPFFDRDLENFKRLHADGAISIGAIVTRGDSLQAAMPELIEAFARSKNIDSISKLEPYYTPTPRQKKLIADASESTGSFAAGWARAFVADKFGEATTHWRKLDERIRRGVGNPCPLLLIGIPRDIVTS